ncbi:MAG: PIN/TRAM domain-containing protein [Candidatus Brocadiia bacterium]
MVSWITRTIFISACALLYYEYYVYFTFVYKQTPFSTYVAPLIGIASGLAVVFLDLLYREKIARNFFAIFIGLIVGVFFSEQVINFLERFLLLYSSSPEKSSSLQQNLQQSVIVPMIPIIYLICCYMSVTVMVSAKGYMRFIIPFVSLRDESRPSGGFILDSSVLIDGRVFDLCRSRLIDSKIGIPRFVLAELQTIADSANKLKRMRGRRGLDIVKKLQQLKEIEVEILEDENNSAMPVDERLVRLTASRNAKIVTNDFNLNKVAGIHGIEVVNINDIANAMKLNIIVGESIEVEIVRDGDGANQGVGYLPDGTMIVVEGARGLVGTRLTAVVTNVYQKDAGRIVFAKAETNVS